MTQERLTDLPTEEEARLREQYRDEMQEIADRFCKERGYILVNEAQTIEDFVNMRLREATASPPVLHSTKAPVP